MNTYNLIIFFLIFLFLNPLLQLFAKDSLLNTDNKCPIYFIKQNWHTAIVFNTADLNSEIFLEYDNFKKYNLIDIGWGDEEFYQYPDFDLGLAFKALFYKTPSTLRVEGLNLSKEEYFDLSEVVIELEITKVQLFQICSFINNSFFPDEDQHTIILSEKADGKIIFYKAKDYYHLFNTCNTWLARCLNYAGINIDENVILTGQLFNELSKIGNVIKAD